MDFEKILDDLNNRLESVLQKSHILGKYTAILFIAAFTFAIRMSGVWKYGRSYGDVSDLLNLKATSEILEDGIFSSQHPMTLLIFRADVPFPGTATITAFLYWWLSLLTVSFQLDTLIQYIAPVCAAKIVILTYLIGAEVKDSFAGVCAAALLSLVPDVFGLFFATLTVWLFIKACKTGAIIFAVLSAVSYFALASTWAGFILISNAIACYVFLVLIVNRSNPNVQRAYTLFFVIGTLLTFQGLAFLLGGVSVVSFFVLPVVGLLSSGVVSGSAEFFKVLSASGSSTWVTFFRDAHLVAFLFPAGLISSIQKANESSLFLVAYTLFALTLTAIWQQAIVILLPILSVLAGVSLSTLLKSYWKQDSTVVKKGHVSREVNVAVVAVTIVMVGFFIVYGLSSAVHPSNFTPPLLLLTVSETTDNFYFADDFRETISWLNHNTNTSSHVLTWPGVGRDILAASHDVALEVDRAKMGKFFLSKEESAYEIAQNLGANYILVVFGGHTGYPHDVLAARDEIVQTQKGDTIGFTPDSALYKLSYKGFANTNTMRTKPTGYDVARNQEISKTSPITLKHFQEVFTSQHWLVRIFYVLPKGVELNEPEEQPTAEPKRVKPRK